MTIYLFISNRFNEHQETYTFKAATYPAACRKAKGWMRRELFLGDYQPTEETYRGELIADWRLREKSVREMIEVER